MISHNIQNTNTFNFKNRFATFLCILFILTSCHTQQKKIIYNPKAVALNNKAAEFTKIQKLDSAIFYFDKALEIDSTYYLPYENKCNIYCTLKDFKTALKVSEKAISVIPDFAEGLFYSGLLNDKLGDSLKAIEYYKQSIKLFDVRISSTDNPKILKGNKFNRAIAYILIGQEDKGQNEIKELMKSYPSDSSLVTYSKLNKQELLQHLI